MPYQVCTNDESVLTLTFSYSNAKDSLCIYIGKILKCSSFYNCLSRNHIYINIFRSFDQNSHHAIYIKIKCLNIKPKLILTYFNIIKEIR